MIVRIQSVQQSAPLLPITLQNQAAPVMSIAANAFTPALKLPQSPDQPQTLAGPIFLAVKSTHPTPRGEIPVPMPKAFQLTGRTNTLAIVNPVAMAFAPFQPSALPLPVIALQNQAAPVMSIAANAFTPALKLPQSPDQPQTLAGPIFLAVKSSSPTPRGETPVPMPEAYQLTGRTNTLAIVNPVAMAFAPFQSSAIPLPITLQNQAAPVMSIAANAFTPALKLPQSPDQPQTLAGPIFLAALSVSALCTFPPVILQTSPTIPAAAPPDALSGAFLIACNGPSFPVPKAFRLAGHDPLFAVTNTAFSIKERPVSHLSPHLSDISLSMKPDKRISRKPLELSFSAPTTVQHQINELLLANIIEDLRSGRINKRSPALRSDLAVFLEDIPFSKDAYEAFQYMLEGSAGNTVQKRIATLSVWAQQYSDGKYAVIVAYYSAYHYCKIKKTDMALASITAYLDRYREYPARIYLLQALCFIQKNDRPQALSILSKIRENHPKSPVMPEALFLSAWILCRDNNVVEARLILAELIQKYPNTTSATKAVQLNKDLSALSSNP